MGKRCLKPRLMVWECIVPSISAWAWAPVGRGWSQECGTGDPPSPAWETQLLP